MTFEAYTLSILSANTAVKALLPAENIFFGTAPDDQPLPCIVCYVVSTTPTLSTDNGAPGSSQLDNLRLQVSFWDRDYVKAGILGRAIRRALEAARPTVYILQNDRTAFDDTTRQNGRIQEYSCWHPEEIPA